MKSKIFIMFILIFNQGYSQDLELNDLKLNEIKVINTNLYDSNLSTYIYEYELYFYNKKGEEFILKKTAGSIGYSSDKSFKGKVNAVHFSPLLGLHSGFNEELVESVVIGFTFNFKLIRKEANKVINEKTIYESSLVKINEVFYYISSIDIK